MKHARMMKQKWGGGRTLCFLALMLLTTHAWGGADTALVISEDWSAVFGGQPITYHVTLSTPVNTRGRLLWRLAANRATIQRGEAVVAPTPAAPIRVAIILDVPEVREGVSMQAVLTVSFVPEGVSEAATSVEKPLWIFASDPFSQRKQWLKDLDIRLFDPEQKTAAAMRKAEIPFTDIVSGDALAEASGIVVIGEGVSFRDYRGLPALMMQAAADGANVLCLAPTDGEFAFPCNVAAGDVRPPEAMQFRRCDIIRELDKRLDATVWPPDGVLVANSMKLVGQRGPIVGEIVTGDEGWPWVRLDYRDGGTLIVVGFTIVAKWDDGPSPRHLFARLLELLAGKSGASASQNKTY